MMVIPPSDESHEIAPERQALVFVCSPGDEPGQEWGNYLVNPMALVIAIHFWHSNMAMEVSYFF